METIDIIEVKSKKIEKSETWDKRYEIVRKDIKTSFWGDFVFGGLLVSGIFIIVESLELPRVYNLTIGIIILSIALIMIFGRLLWPLYAQRLIMKYMILAKKYYENGAYKEAILCIDKVLKYDSEYKHGWNSKGNILSDAGIFLEAIQCYDKALVIDFNYKEAWHNKGRALYNILKFEDALDCFDHVLIIDPNDKQVWSYKGMTLGYMGNYEGASKCFYKALEIDSEFGDSYYNLACIESLKGAKEEALKFLKKAIDLNGVFMEYAYFDDDFNNFREDEEFINLVRPT